MTNQINSMVFKFKIEDTPNIEKMSIWLEGSLGYLVDIEMDKIIIDVLLKDTQTIKNSFLDLEGVELISEVIEEA